MKEEKYWKRALLIVFYIVVSFNIAAVIVWLKRQGLNIDFSVVLKIHYEVSAYAIKCSLIAIYVDWITKDQFSKNKKSK